MTMLRLRTIDKRFLLAAFVALVLLAAIACDTAQVQLIEGVLQSVDSANGQITVVTKDGKTVTLTIATDAPVETEGAGSTLPGSTFPPTVETLEPGASITVEVNDDRQVAQRVKARQAKVEGVIVKVEGQQVTVESERGRQVTVTVTDRTRIELDDDFPGALADLRAGVEVKIKFDSDSLLAFKIDTEEEEAEIKGIVVVVEGNEVTIETKRGRRLMLVVSDRTRIELEDDFPGTISDLQVGVEVKTKFDPFNRTAFKIEVKEEEEAEIKGIVSNVVGNEVTVQTERGATSTLIIGDRTRVELEDDISGTLADIQAGVRIEADFDPISRSASKIEVLKEEGAKIEGVVTHVSGNQVTVETKRGRSRTVVIDDRTRIELDDDFAGTMADLQVGIKVEAKFDAVTRMASKVEVQDGEGKEERKGKIKGVVIEINGNEITVETERGDRRTITVARSTRIKLEDDPPGALGDLREGDEVEIKYNPVTGVAQKIELDD